jgi:hypothetical protein
MFFDQHDGDTYALQFHERGKRGYKNHLTRLKIGPEFIKRVILPPLAYPGLTSTPLP